MSRNVAVDDLKLTHRNEVLSTVLSTARLLRTVEAVNNLTPKLFGKRHENGTITTNFRFESA